ncbi:DUF2167 domain-containing protein [Caulobacter sp. NIBR1757]|uniref:DUF2167 domain-containing protein n=1 Tax=Caulobacter sp. NIBR1757 TaxID=3016000 RepID=UPI0022F0A8D1|nr:DUF2167 domain-containing protein [Caulobacter sp. NIBR1757]
MFFKRVFAAVALAAACFSSAPVLAQAPSAPAAQAQPDVSWQDKISRQTGTVHLAAAGASLALGDDYYFIDADGARQVLVEGWGNPPDAAEGVLGMIFPTRFKPMDDASWGAVITFEETGWVSDKDAATTDYDKLLTELRRGEDDRNAEREKAGYPTVNLIGWAERPTYNDKSHVAIWARELSFNGGAKHGLNYDIRVLGRRGVLSLNVVSAMTDLTEIHGVAGEIANTAAFEQGAAYADYKPGVDKSAGYGIAGLIAAGAGVAAVKKLGLLGLILAFGKKFIVIIIAAFGGIAAWFRNLFGKKDLSVGGGAAPARPSIFDEPAAPAESPDGQDKPPAGSGDIVS